MMHSPLALVALINVGVLAQDFVTGGLFDEGGPGKLVGAFHKCSDGVTSLVNPPTNAISIRDPATNTVTGLAGDARARMYDAHAQSIHLPITPRGYCGTAPVTINGYRLIDGNHLRAIPSSELVNDPAGYISHEPVYVGTAFPFNPKQHIDVLVHGWIDAASNWKICSWAIRADSSADIIATEKLVKC